MPTFRNRTVFEITRDIRVFLHLETGLTRSESPGPSWSGGADKQEVSRLRRELATKDKKLTGLRSKTPESDGVAKEDRGVKAENVVWIFGSGRSGTTWLSSMMGDIKDHTVWPEPMAGRLFGNFYISTPEAKRKSRWFVMGPERKQRETWLRLIRSFVLDMAGATFPRLASGGGTLVVKEPHGSVGAPLMMEALPESRMILLVRDPRDIMASWKDASTGSWGRNAAGRDERRKDSPTFDIESRVNGYLQQIGPAKQAYEAHEGHKVLVRYEDLRANTLGTMKRIYSSLGIDVDGEELERVVEKHSWENIPSEKKGEGKFYRKASPGSWRGDLSPDQVKIVEKMAAPLLEEFYDESP